MELITNSDLTTVLGDAPRRTFPNVQHHLLEGCRFLDTGDFASWDDDSMWDMGDVADQLKGVLQSSTGKNTHKSTHESTHKSTYEFTLSTSTTTKTTNLSMFIDAPTPTSTTTSTPTSTPTSAPTSAPTSTPLLERIPDLTFQTMPCPNGEYDTLLYCFTSALLPEMSTYSKGQRHTYYRELRTKLAYDLDEAQLYINFGYKKVHNKAKMQTELLNGRPIEKAWFRRYLCDYFNINLVVLVGNMLYIGRPLQRVPTILMSYERRRLELVLYSGGNGIFPASFVDTLTSLQAPSLTQLKGVSTYKAADLQDMAKALDIPTEREVGIRKKAKRKDELYGEIRTHLGWLVM